jgi:autonomous glycyl radical cofactor GrcA
MNSQQLGELKMLITKADMIKMDRTAVSIKGVIDTLRVKIKMVDADIKQTEKSKMEFERHLGLLVKRQEELQRRVKQNQQWIAKYDVEVGPFAQRYDEMTAQISDIYMHAKKGHQKGIVLLETEFGYHPAFKRPKDTFTATAFRPWNPPKV